MLDFLSQSLWLLIIFGILSIAVLVSASSLAVKKLTGLAGYFRLSTTFMGVTVVSLATSIPEIAAHFTASFGILSGALDFEVSSAVVLGANIGSDVVQQTLIMAIVVLMAGGLRFRRYFLWKSMIPMIATTIMCIVLGIDGIFSRVDGIILFSSFLAYMFYLYVDERKHYKEQDHGFSEEGETPKGVPANAKEAWRDAIIALVALLFTVGSAMIALQATEIVVSLTGIGGSLIGVITLGLASALPELITAISGVRYGDSGISLGTLIGSNITNPLVAIGGGAIISTYWVPRPLVMWDLPWETVTGAILWLILWFNKGKLGKWSAYYLIALYFVYISMRMIFFSID
jgi:cation:H+ antiporter